MRDGNGGTATLTDEQILEIEPGEKPSSAPVHAETSAQSSAGSASNDEFEIVDSERPDLSARQGGAERERGDGEAGEPAWLAALEAQPAAAAEARRWQAAAKDVAELDAAYFSADEGARSGLAARLYERDPAAFREMLASSARTLAARDPQGLAELARQLGMPLAEPAAGVGKSVAQAARAAVTTGDVGGRRQPAEAGTNGNPQSAANEHGAAFPAESYRAFETTTNEDVSRRMHEAIDRSLSSALPEGIAAGARRRIGEDIFHEVHAALASDRELARQVGEVLRDWRFDARARQQVTALVSGRARAVLPEVARRVVAEWTSSVLASDRAKTARIDAAAARRDITGGRVPEPVAGTHRPREIDYRRMSDEQILDI